MQKQVTSEISIFIIKNEKAKSDTNLTTMLRWLSVFSIYVTLIGIYYKSEEIKSLLSRGRQRLPASWCYCQTCLFRTAEQT